MCDNEDVVTLTIEVPVSLQLLRTVGQRIVTREYVKKVAADEADLQLTELLTEEPDS